MGWSEREGVDYDDAKRPTADEETNATGWIAYYSWGRGGGGMYTPHYHFAPDMTNQEELRDWIVDRFESWMQFAESANLTIHRGVTPPAKVVLKAYEYAEERVVRANGYVKRMAAEVTKYASDEEL
jgi:hypothetical protein